MSLTTTLSASVLASLMVFSPLAQEVKTSTNLKGSTESTATPNPTGEPVEATADTTPSPEETLTVDKNAEGQDVETSFTTAKASVKKVSSIKLDKNEVNIIGVEWEGEGDPKPELRYKDVDGTWSSWASMNADDMGADPSSPDAVNEVEGASDTVPVFNATEAQVRFADSSVAGVKTPKINLVSTEVTDEDKEVANKNPDLLSINALTGKPDTTVDAAKYNANMKANVVTRKEWGANEKQVRCKSSVASSAKGVIVHHTAGSNSYSKAQAPGIIRGYLTYHTQSRGWCDLGYNFLVDKYGTIYEGRAGSLDKAIVGAHSSGFNTGTVGISVMGTYTGSAPSTAAQNSVARVVAYNANKYGFNPTGKMTMTSGGGGTSKYAKGKKISMNVVSGHRDTSYTECPGISFYNRLGSIRTKAKNLQSDLKNTPSPTPTPKPTPPKPEYSIKGDFSKYYNAKGGVKKFGNPVGNEKKLSNPAGYVQGFEKGSMYRSSKTPVKFVFKGAIMNKWESLRYEKGELGFPRGDQYKLKNASEARGQNFQNGTIITSNKGTYVVKGAIGTKWKKMGWANGYLKRPISDQKCGLKDGGCFQKFEGGSIHWSKKTGAHATKKSSAIQKKWGNLKYERGYLGYPKSGQYGLLGAKNAYGQTFQGGTIYTSKQGTYVVKGAIDKKYRSLKRANGRLKLPVGEEYSSSKNVVKQKFQKGTISYNKSTKKTSVSYKK